MVSESVLKNKKHTKKTISFFHLHCRQKAVQFNVLHKVTRTCTINTEWSTPSHSITFKTLLELLTLVDIRMRAHKRDEKKKKMFVRSSRTL